MRTLQYWFCIIPYLFLENISLGQRFEKIQILNVQMIYYFLFVAFVCFAFPTELLTTKFGNFFLIGNAFFWLLRTIQQFIFLRANHIKIHILTITFLIGTLLFVLPILTS
jgi:hypothetical protein